MWFRNDFFLTLSLIQIGHSSSLEKVLSSSFLGSFCFPTMPTAKLPCQKARWPLPWSSASTWNSWHPPKSDKSEAQLCTGRNCDSQSLLGHISPPRLLPTLNHPAHSREGAVTEQLPASRQGSPFQNPTAPAPGNHEHIHFCRLSHSVYGSPSRLRQLSIIRSVPEGHSLCLERTPETAAL